MMKMNYCISSYSQSLAFLQATSLTNELYHYKIVLIVLAAMTAIKRKIILFPQTMKQLQRATLRN